VKETPENRGRDEVGRFRPGVSGNPGGRPRNILREVAQEHAERPGGREELAAAHRAQVKAAMSGNTRAYVAVRDTLEPPDADVGSVIAVNIEGWPNTRPLDAVQSQDGGTAAPPSHLGGGGTPVTGPPRPQQFPRADGDPT